MNIINDDKNKEISKILNISFNQDNSCFSLGTEKGFMIFQTYPIKNHFEREMDGGIKIAEMYYRTNLLALIGGGDIPKFNPKKLVMWDDYQNKMISEIKFFSILKKVKLNNDKIFAICERNIYVFDIKTFESLEIIETKDNPKGLFGISNELKKLVIAYPQRVDKDSKETTNKTSILIKNYNKNTTVKITTQEDIISYISLNNDGTLLAYSNEKGTIIRIHSCINSNLLSEFYRGKEKAEINYICFDKLNNYLAVTSDRGTIHIWSMSSVIDKLKDIKNKDDINDNENEPETLEEEKIKIDDKNENKIIEENSNEKEILPRNKKAMFGNTEKSFAQIRINSNKSICSFQKNNIIVVVTYDGMYYQAQLDKNGGNCKIIFQDSLNNLKK